jgi:hypothetical protein
MGVGWRLPFEDDFLKETTKDERETIRKRILEQAIAWDGIKTFGWDSPSGKHWVFTCAYSNRDHTDIDIIRADSS